MRTVAVAVLLLSCVILRAGDTPRKDEVRPIPPPGIKLTEADQKEFDAGLQELGKEIDAIRADKKLPPALKELLPDVQIYHNAIRYALQHQEFFNEKEIPGAKKLLATGLERARQLKEGKPAWTSASGLIPRGYVSKIDGSVQPYGLVVPPSFEQEPARPRRLDFWFHGRGETLSENNFLQQRHNQPGEFVPPDTIVAHLYGRYCNANKFAGEVDLFEALADIKKRYAIDDNRIVVRGFSMGGAACWQFATHFAGRWAAAAPGAGFSETADFCKIMQDPANVPPAYEQTLWHIYDATDYAVNLFNCPLVVYSGEKDRQIQAAQMMEKALAAEGLAMVHIIGPGTEHKYHPDSKIEINRRIDAIAARGRNPAPQKVKFTTWTLRYNQMLWVTVDALGKHWERARVDAEITGPSSVKVTTQNVTALTLDMPSGHCPLEQAVKPKVTIDGAEIEAAPVQTDRSWVSHFRKNGNTWAAAPSAQPEGLRKIHGLQGPIDDAFMDSFLIVKPTGAALNEKVGGWVNAELPRAIDQWRKTYRGEARVTTDDKLTDAEIAAHNLVLWGDFKSNKVLAQIADKLPIKWSEAGIGAGAQKFSADHHVPLLVYPNPLNPKRYVVINSGFTFREFHHLNNARQVAILPDYAIIDINTPPSPKLPGAVVKAGFFGEQWELKE